MIFDTRKTKEHLTCAKNIFMNNGWIAVLYGVLISLIGSPIASAIGKTISSALSSALRGLPYDLKNMILDIPSSLLSSIVTGISTVFLLGGLIYIIKNNSKIDIPNFVQIGINLCQKYFKEIALLLVIPKVVIDVIGEAGLDFLTDYIQYELITSFFSGIWLTTILITVVAAIYGGVSIGVNMYCTGKFIVNMDEVNVSNENNKFLFSTMIKIAVVYSLLSLVPIVGGLIALVIAFGFTFFFEPFVLSMDSNIKSSPAASKDASINMNRGNYNGDIFANKSQNNNFNGMNQQNGLNNNGYNQYNNGYNPNNGYNNPNYNKGYNNPNYNNPNSGYNNQGYNNHQNINQGSNGFGGQQFNQGFNPQYNNQGQYSNQHNGYNNNVNYSNAQNGANGRPNYQNNSNYNTVNQSAGYNNTQYKVCPRCGLQLHNQVQVCPRCGTTI